MDDYSKPDKSQWPPNDPRQILNEFDEDKFRKQYNDWMPREQPILPEVRGALNAKELKVANLFLKRKSKNLLDIGCGNGRFAICLVKDLVIPEALLIDISDEMVKNARETARLNGVEIRVIRSSLESFSTDERFDVITAFELLEHIFNLREGLEKIKSLLNPGGIFAGAVPKLKICDAVVHLHYFTMESLKNLLAEYFVDIFVEEIDLTGLGEIHLIFSGERLNN